MLYKVDMNYQGNISLLKHPIHGIYLYPLLHNQFQNAEYLKMLNNDMDYNVKKLADVRMGASFDGEVGGVEEVVKMSPRLSER